MTFQLYPLISGVFDCEIDCSPPPPPAAGEDCLGDGLGTGCFECEEDVVRLDDLEN